MRKIADCRDFPSESRCSLTIAGTEDEVVRAAAEHAASVHGHEDTPELREQIRATLEDEGPAGRYGTVMIAKLNGSVEALSAAAQDWIEQRHAAGFLAEEILLADDGSTVVVPVFFDNRDDYRKLADDPDQDAWWKERMAPHLSDVRWIDGTWQQSLFRAAPSQPAEAPSP
jgi:predicted small metal-binding protein